MIQLRLDGCCRLRLHHRWSHLGATIDGRNGCHGYRSCFDYPMSYSKPESFFEFCRVCSALVGVKQYHKPTMTGNGKFLTPIKKNREIGGQFMALFYPQFQKKKSWPVASSGSGEYLKSKGSQHTWWGACCAGVDLEGLELGSKGWCSSWVGG